MKERKIFLVTDLGGGDGGKGGVVHKICVEKQAHTVLKVGGAQGSHGVRTSHGERFNFSQFGCGTFEGAMTHITDIMVVEPLRFLVEADELKREWGIGNIFDYITVDENALCTTPFHTIASRLRELSRKENAKGTIGVGVGEAMLDSEAHPELVIRAGDIGKPNIREMLEAVRFLKMKELTPIIENVGDLWSEDRELARQEIEFLRSDAYLTWIVERYKLMAANVKFVGHDYLKEEILSRDGVVVVESSHGILTDRYHGFHPHTSRIRTVPQGTLRLLEKCGYEGDIIRLGVSRAYQIRHGAGVMVTESDAFLEKLLPGSNKDENRWQGKVRVGALDLVTLRYSIDVCGGPKAFDGLAITWFDQIPVLGRWPVCDSYIGTNGHGSQEFFSPEGDILVRRGSDQSQLDHQKALGDRMRKCQPKLTWHDLPPGGRDCVIELCADVLSEKLEVPVRMVSFGQTEDDKICI